MARREQSHPDFASVLFGTKRVRGRHLPEFPCGQPEVFAEDFPARIGGADLFSDQRPLEGCSRWVDQIHEHRHQLAGLVANLRGRNVQHAWGVENRDSDLGFVQVHDRRDAVGRRVPLHDHFRAVGFGRPRHVEGQGDGRVALRREVDAIDASLAMVGPLARLLVVGYQGQHESRRQGRQVFGTQPERE